MDNRLKQRLVGAAVLISLIAVFVPLIFDGPEQHGGFSEKANIPFKPNQQFRSKIIPLDEEPTTAERAPVRIMAETPSAGPKIPTPTAPAPHATARAVPPAASGKPVKPAPPPSAAAKAVTPAPPRSPVKPAMSVLGKDGAGTDSGTDSGTRAAPAAGVAAPARQSGAELVEKSAPARTPAVPVAAAGSSAVRKLATESRKAPLADAGGPGPGIEAWVVQVGSFSAEQNALALRNWLRSMGHLAFVERAHSGSGDVYRVRVGPESAPLLANEILKKIEKDTKLKGMVVRYP